MGCYNGTCGVSQLPILGGERVKCIVLIQGMRRDVRADGTCDIGEYFLPLFFPVSCEYNDYGSVENIDYDWNTEWIWQKIVKWRDDGIITCNGKLDHLEDVFDRIRDGDIVYNYSEDDFEYQYNTTARLGLFMVIEGVYNSLVDFVKTDNRFDVSDMPERFLALEVLGSGNQLMEYEVGYGCDFALYITKKKSIPVEHFDMFKEMWCFRLCMYKLRRQYLPATGCGSQSNEWEYYRKLNESMETYMEQMINEYEKGVNGE